MSDSAFESGPVSGFYWPASMAAWGIPLFASWIPMNLKGSGSNLHHIEYAIYTNWAAIDLLRLTSRTWSRLDDDSPRTHVFPEDVRAPSAVVQISINHAILQFLVCLRTSRTGNTKVNGVLSRRRYVVSVGPILPIIASSYYLAFVRKFFDLRNQIYHIKDGVKNTTETGPTRLFFSFLLSMTLSCFIVMNFVSGESVSASMTKAVKFVTMIIVFACSLTVATPAIGWENCFLVPCGPQSILEWDQAYALVVVLVLFFHEF